MLQEKEPTQYLIWPIENKPPPLPVGKETIARTLVVKVQVEKTREAADHSSPSTSRLKQSSGGGVKEKGTGWGGEGSAAEGKML